MVALAEGESDGEAGVDAYGGACADVEVAAAEAPCDGGGLLVCELAGALCGAEGGGGGAGEGGGVVVVLLLLESGVDRRRREGHWSGWRCVGVGIRARRAESALEAALARQHLAAPRLAGVARHTCPPDRRPLGCCPSAVRPPVQSSRSPFRPPSTVTTSWPCPSCCSCCVSNVPCPSCTTSSAGSPDI